LSSTRCCWPAAGAAEAIFVILAIHHGSILYGLLAHLLMTTR